MKMNPPKPRPPDRNEYRVRFIATAGLSEPTPVTARPGIIKNNRPHAEKILASLLPHRDAWLEVKAPRSDEWKRITR